MSRIGTCLASFFVLGATLACGDDGNAGNGSPDAGAGGTGNVEAVSFAEDVYPILLNKCAGSGCHSNNSVFQPGHAAPVVTDAYDATQAVSPGGVPVYDRILARTSGDDPSGIMPPESFGPMPCEGELGAPGCLTVAEYEVIEEWIAQGAPP